MAIPTARADQFYPLQGEYGWDDKNIIANGITNASLAANTIGSGQINPTVMQTINVSLTQANIVAMYTTPVVVIPAVTGSTIVLVSALLRYVYGVHAFTSGGVVDLQYGTTANGAGTTPLTTVAASVLLATSSSDTQMQTAATTTTAAAATPAATTATTAATTATTGAATV